MYTRLFLEYRLIGLAEILTIVIMSISTFKNTAVILYLQYVISIRALIHVTSVDKATIKNISVCPNPTHRFRNG